MSPSRRAHGWPSTSDTFRRPIVRDMGKDTHAGILVNPERPHLSGASAPARWRLLATRSGGGAKPSCRPAQRRRGGLRPRDVLPLPCAVACPWTRRARGVRGLRAARPAAPRRKVSVLFAGTEPQSAHRCGSARGRTVTSGNDAAGRVPAAGRRLVPASGRDPARLGGGDGPAAGRPRRRAERGRHDQRGGARRPLRADDARPSLDSAPVPDVVRGAQAGGADVHEGRRQAFVLCVNGARAPVTPPDAGARRTTPLPTVQRE